jgi:hypothetical protein
MFLRARRWEAALRVPDHDLQIEDCGPVVRVRRSEHLNESSSATWENVLGGAGLIAGVTSLTFLPLPMIWQAALPLAAVGLLVGVAGLAAGWKYRHRAGLLPLLAVGVSGAALLLSANRLIDREMTPNAHPGGAKSSRLDAEGDAMSAVGPKANFLLKKWFRHR